jgi:hypothetical protein
MKTFTINDYYPLSFDIQELTLGKETKKTKKANKVAFIDPKGELNKPNTDADTLIGMAKVNNLSDLQSLVLLIKNAFEGQVYLAHDLNKDILINQGTMIIDWNNQKMIELTESFNQNLEIFLEGLYKGWVKLSSEGMESGEFNNLVSVIVNSQIFKLPVSLLKKTTISFVQDNLVGKQFYNTLAPIVNKIVADKILIELIDEKYNKTFSDLIQEIESKANCLGMLQVKLNLANQPNVRNQDDLQHAFHEFIIQERGRVNSTMQPVSGFQGGQDNRLKTVEKSTGKVFRAISKQCREIFTAGPEDKENSILNDFFMIASKYWNSGTDSITDQLINYFMLTHLYFRVIIYRTFSGLSVNVEYLFLLEEKWLSNDPIEKLQSGLKNYEGRIEIEKLFHRTYFKIKNLEDKEISRFHKEYLAKKIKNFEQEIVELENRINGILNDK